MRKQNNTVISKSIKRRGVHSKKKTSSNKNSKNYKKKYNRQGRV